MNYAAGSSTAAVRTTGRYDPCIADEKLMLYLEVSASVVLLDLFGLLSE